MEKRRFTYDINPPLRPYRLDHWMIIANLIRVMTGKKFGWAINVESNVVVVYTPMD